jgi:translation initiation factor 4G
VPGEAKATVVLPDDEVDPTISFIAPIDTELAAPPGLQEKPVAASATQERVDMAPVAEKHEPLESKSVDPKPDADPKPAKKASFDRGAKPPGLPVDDKGGWRREKPVVALSVQKYSKEEIVAMFERGVHQIPEALRAWYPDAKEQGPLASTPRGSGSTGANTSARGGGSGVRRVGGSGGSAGAAASSRYNTPPPPPLSAEELAMFDPNKENVFKYQPTLLSDTADPEVVVKKANLLLNKLSLDKFDKLSREFMDVGIEDPAIMNRSVDLIVSKAQMEEHFSSMYAELCRKIHDEWTAKSEGREVDTGKMFRDLLLSRCEDEFATNWVAKLSVIRSSDMGEEDKVEKEILLKRKYTGHMIFIGEIYLKDMVRAAIMRNCINELMESNEVWYIRVAMMVVDAFYCACVCVCVCVCVV